MKNGKYSDYAEKISAAAKAASVAIANLDRAKKNALLKDAARLMKARKKFIESENTKDIEFAKADGLSPAMIDRLKLDSKRIDAMAESILAVAALPDPVGQLIERWRRPNGLKISKVRVPLGVILIIYEARPNVTQECASLCLKSGNAVILKGGREAFNSNKAIARIFRETLKKHRLPEDAVVMVDKTDRAVVDELLKLTDLINLVIPRGGESLIRKVAEQSRIPVIKHFKGNCHVYVDKDADLEKAVSIVYNAKCQRPSVCNAMETLLVHRSVAPVFLPRLATKLREARCEMRGCPETRRYVKEAKAATEQDWHEEYLDLIMAVKVVKDIDEAIGHIQKYGSGHTEAIVSRDRKSAIKFTRLVDSSSVMVNTTTRFSDGFQYGFGAEIGISTDKIHARGPMGLEGLTSYKYVVEGSGQIRT